MVTASSEFLRHGQQLPFVLLEPAGRWPPTEPRREPVVSLQPNRRYDRWRDAEGTHIPVGCRVEQVAIAKEHGALTSRLHKRGDVISRSRGSRLQVRFDGETKPVGIRPHLVQVIALNAEQIVAELEQARELAADPAVQR
jgi:hypothetical protein